MEKEKKTLEDKALDDVTGGAIIRVIRNTAADAETVTDGRPPQMVDAALASTKINGNFVPGK